MLCARKQSRREKKTYLDDNFFVFFPAGAWGVPVIGILLGSIRK